MSQTVFLFVLASHVLRRPLFGVSTRLRAVAESQLEVFARAARADPLPK